MWKSGNHQEKVTVFWFVPGLFPAFHIQRPAVALHEAIRETPGHPVTIPSGGLGEDSLSIRALFSRRSTLFVTS